MLGFAFFPNVNGWKFVKNGRWWWKWETMLTSIILFKVNWCTLVLLYFEVDFVYSRIWGEQIMSTNIFSTNYCTQILSQCCSYTCPRNYIAFLTFNMYIYLYIYTYIIHLSDVVFLVVPRISLHTKKTPETTGDLERLFGSLPTNQGKIMMRSPSIWHASPWTLTHA